MEILQIRKILICVKTWSALWWYHNQAQALETRDVFDIEWLKWALHPRGMQIRFFIRCHVWLPGTLTSAAAWALSEKVFWLFWARFSPALRFDNDIIGGCCFVVCTLGAHAPSLLAEWETLKRCRQCAGCKKVYANVQQCACENCIRLIARLKSPRSFFFSLCFSLGLSLITAS